jgi:hypothetical protein
MSSLYNALAGFKPTTMPLTSNECSYETIIYKVYDCLWELPALSIMKVQYLKAVVQDDESVAISLCKVLSSFRVDFAVYG